MEEHVAEEVRRPLRFQVVMAGAGPNIDADSCSRGGGFFSANSDSIRKSGCLEVTVVFKRLGDFATR